MFRAGPGCLRLSRIPSLGAPRLPSTPLFAQHVRHASTKPVVEPTQDPSLDSLSDAARPTRRRNNVRFAVLLGLFGAGSYLLGSTYPPETLQLLVPPPAKPIATEGSVEAQAYAKNLEREILGLPHVRRLLASASATASDPSLRAHYLLSRPFQDYPEHMRKDNLTAGSLRKPGMLAVPYVVLSKTEHGARALGGFDGDAFAFVHLGRALCGHHGIVHGGLLATVLDETLARTAFFHLPHHVGVTAHLEIDYKSPVKADSLVIIETKTIEHEGRKAWVQATMRDMRGRTLVESKALFVEPKLAKWLDLSAVQHVMDMKRDE